MPHLTFTNDAWIFYNDLVLNDIYLEPDDSVGLLISTDDYGACMYNCDLDYLTEILNTMGLRGEKILFAVCEAVSNLKYKRIVLKTREIMEDGRGFEMPGAVMICEEMDRHPKDPETVQFDIIGFLYSGK